MRVAAFALLLGLAACGRQGELMRPAPPGQVPAVDPAKPLPSALLVPTPQEEPTRVDDPLSKSTPRRDDYFNLPPKH